MFFNPVLSELRIQVHLTVWRQCNSLAAGSPSGKSCAWLALAPLRQGAAIMTGGDTSIFRCNCSFSYLPSKITHFFLLCVKTFTTVQNYCVSDGSSFLALLFNRIFHSSLLAGKHPFLLQSLLTRTSHRLSQPPHTELGARNQSWSHLDIWVWRTLIQHPLNQPQWVILSDRCPRCWMMPFSPCCYLSGPSSPNFPALQRLIHVTMSKNCLIATLLFFLAPCGQGKCRAL